MSMTDCVEITKGLDRDGYPILLIKRKRCRAARYLYEQTFGKIEDKKVIDHLCRNRKCINLEHLEVVTIVENTRRGTSAKITMTDAQEIRKLYKNNNMKQTELANIYKIGQDEISRIVNERRWA